MCHAGLLNLVENVQGQVQGKAHNYVHHSSISFDAALFEVWVPLLTGACVTLHAPAFNIESLADCVRASHCDVLLLTTSLFHLVAQHRLQMLDGVRVLYVGGEVLKPAYARALLAANREITLVNGYGPTENTVFSTWHSMSSPRTSSAMRSPSAACSTTCTPRSSMPGCRKWSPGLLASYCSAGAT